MTIPAPVARHFTLEEANRTLPLVRVIVRDVVELYADIQPRRERLQVLQNRRGSARERDPYSEEVDEMEKQLDADLARLQELADELAGIGAELKDPVSGLVDFPTLIDGREVLLCWKPGEESIQFWHELHTGFAGRRPIPHGTE